MATEPVVDSVGGGAEFQRLDSVRARQRSQRKRRLLIALTFVITLAAGASIASTIVRGLGAPPPRPDPRRAQPAAGIRPQAHDVPAASIPAVSASTAAVDTPVRRDRPAPEAARPPRGRPAADVKAPAREEPQTAEAKDPGAVIDWLLKRSSTATR